MISATISGVSVSVGNASFSLEDPLEARAILTFTVLDSAGTASYQRGQPVTFSDPGIISYSGFVQSDTPTKDGIILPYVEHVIVCMDGEYNLDKRSNSTNYLNWVAGNIAVDFVRTTLVNDGITIAAAMHRDTTASDFNAGNLSGTVGATNANVSINNGLAQTLSATDDGDLELTPAGSTVTITESTTANFSTGALINVTAASNTLSPVTESAILMTTQLPIAAPGAAGTTYIYQTIWSGSQVVGTLDALNYDIWIDASSPAFNCGIDLNFSDSTTLHSYAGPIDQNTYPASTLTDLSTFAKGAWYTRNISLTSALNGKTVNSVTIGVTGVASGTYTLYIRNCYLSSHSGTPFFSTSATTTNVNPSTTSSFIGYIPALTSTSVVQVMTGAVANRVSPAYSISAVQLVASSIVTWSVVTPATSTFQLAVSYDGNAFLLCTNNQPLPCLPAGSLVSGVNLYFMEIFTTGADPTNIPQLTGVTVQINPAPAATKSDVVTNYGTSAQWNAGTLNYLAPNSNGDLTLGTIARNWNDTLITNQSFFQGNGTTSASQSASTGAYKITAPVASSPNFGQSRFDFANFLADFTAEWDMSLSNFGSIAFLYRTTGWASTYDLNWGYAVYFDNINLYLIRGTNINNPVFTSSSTGVQTVPQTFVLGTTYHFKLVATGSNHQIYLNHATTPIINATDSAYSTGNIGFVTYGNSSGSTVVGTIDNLVVTPATFGTWTSPGVPLSSLTTIAGSTISWLETLASGAASATAAVQASIDGGSTFQTCTQNATIPGLTPGTNVAALSLIIKITLYANSIATEPIIGGLNWRVLGAFPTVTGTRDTAPAGNDTQITRTSGSTWGNAFDGQAWAKVGTATAATGSNVATLTNTTGDTFELLGSRTLSDGEVTDLVQLSAGTISAGLVLRYVDSSHYYYLALSTTALSIVKNIGAGDITIASTPGTYSTGVDYRMRFRATGIAPTTLQGKVWPAGTLEPGVNLGILSATNPQWGVVGSD